MKKIQIIRQTEAAECGLACLAMIANYHGHEFDLATLRTRYPTSNRGMQLTTLLETASKLGLQTKAVKVELSYLKKIKTPSVLHWGLDHYVVLESVSGNGIKIFDPAKGVSKLSYDMASDLFTGIAVIFSKAESFEPQRGKSELSLVSLISSSVGLKQTLWKILILSFSLEMLALMIPFYFQWVLDNSIGAGQEAVVSSVSAGFLLITLIFSMLYFCRGWVLAKVGTETNALWSTALYRHLLRLPLSWFEKRYKGDILTKFDSLRVVQATLTGQAVSALIDGCISLLILSLAFVYDTQMATILTICFASYACARFFIIKCVRQRTEELIINRGMAQQEVVDSLIGIMPIKLNHKYSMREVRHRKCVDKVSDNDFRLQVLGVLVGALNQALPVVTRILIVWVGAFKVIDGALSLGMLIGIIAYAELFFIRATLSLDKCSELWVVKAHLARVSDIVLTPRTQVREGVLVKSLDRFDIEVAGLAFRYSDDIDWVLRDVSFKVEEGQSVALVGKSGCGKSTLSKLILGLMPAAAGKVLIGGIPVNFIEEETIGSIVGSVTQDDKLFSGTILDNISFWDHQVTFEKVKAAAELAKVSLEIERLPMGYHTLVGDMGASLSGGQTQRILLARALYKKPKILLLDEATSNLDVALEKSVNEAIGNLAITRIIIAHRPETIRSADLIIDLEYLNQTSRLRHEDRI